MKKLLLISILLSCIGYNFAFNEVSFSGMNEAKYIFKQTDDNDFNFYSDDLTLDFTMGKFRLGTTVSFGNIPDNFQYITDIELEEEDPEFELSDAFVEFSSDSILLTGGYFSAVMGSGLVINAYNNEDIMDGDNRLLGGYSEFYSEKFKLMALYGLSDNNQFTNDNETNYDHIYGVDFDFDYFDKFKFGGSLLQEKFYQNNLEEDYNQKLIYAGRFLFSNDFLDWKTEYAQNKRSDGFEGDVDGSAIYSNLNVYAGQFTFTTAYKNYDRFEDRFNELPTVNNSELAIAEYGDSSIPGYDEQGVQGIIRYTPNYDNEFIFDYAEGWSADSDYQQSDLHAEYIRQFAFSSLTLEYSQTERMADSPTTYYWEKETKPKLTYDFIIKEFPIVLKAEFKTKEKDEYGIVIYEYEPAFQSDFSWKDYALSLLVTHKFHNEDDFDKNPLKIGGEFTTNIFDNTEIKLFAGSEKGGQVCRNGVCNYQAPFEGVRLELNTRF